MSGDRDVRGRDEELRSLRERAKELKCVYDVVSALSRREEPPQAVFRRVLEGMPPAWQYPEDATARIEYLGRTHALPDFVDTPWRQRSTISLWRTPVGAVEVLYKQPKPAAWEGPFLREERQLLDNIAQRIADDSIGSCKVSTIQEIRVSRGPDQAEREIYARSSGGLFMEHTGNGGGFVRSSPNEVLMRFAREERSRGGDGRLLDLGCGAGRNALPLADEGWHVLGTDLSWPMLRAAAGRVRETGLQERVALALSPMDQVPGPSRSFDLIVAHGIWNLARSASEFRRAVAEAARVARPGAGLFVFTFSRNTLPAGAKAVGQESFVFDQFSGEPQCFLTASQLLFELGAAGFAPDGAVPLTEYNRPQAGLQCRSGPPVIYEAAFRRMR